MQCDEAQEYLAESNKKFLVLLRSLAAEYDHLCGYTQAIAREVTVNNELGDGVAGVAHTDEHIEPYHTWLTMTSAPKTGNPSRSHTQSVWSTVHAPSKPACPDEVASAEAPPSAFRCTFKVENEMKAMSLGQNSHAFSASSRGLHSGKSSYVCEDASELLRPGYSSLSWSHDKAELEDHPHVQDNAVAAGNVRHSPYSSQSRHSSGSSKLPKLSIGNHVDLDFPRLSLMSGIDGISPQVIHRLQARLGILDYNSMITPLLLYHSVQSLGLEKYTKAQIRKLIHRMRTVAGLVDEDEGVDSPPTSTGESGHASGIMGKWRSMDFAAAVGFKVTSITTGNSDALGRGIPFKNFAAFLISKRQQLGPDCEDMVLVLREVLLSGDTNRLVAELTSVRVDDLATPLPRLDWDSVLEPFIGFVILLNGITIGLQTDATNEHWSGWFLIELAFTIFFLFELGCRLLYSGLAFYTGQDRNWAYLDTMVVFLAIIDTSLQLLDVSFSVGALTIVRTSRLTRITRLFRIFRLGFLRELNIMVKGLFAGCKTLFWAIVLLFFTIYIMAVFATHTLGKNPGNAEVGREELFTTVPRAMLTSFRCFVGDCTTSEGHALVKLLSDAHGISFVLPYLASFTLVTLGLFNLIMALYVETTMAFAKRTEEKDKRRRERESLRVAHITKKLLKKFIVAQRMWEDPQQSQPMTELKTQAQRLDITDVEVGMTISKELFLVMVQDQEVQRLMNDLDIPPDRANLFDVLDADGTGDLHVTELVHGLLKIRGEARKSDLVGSFLAVRATQEMLRLMERRLLKNQNRILNELGVHANTSSRMVSIWDPKAKRSSEGQNSANAHL